MKILHVCTNGSILQTSPTLSSSHQNGTSLRLIIHNRRALVEKKTWNFEPKNQHTLLLSHTHEPSNNRVTRRMCTLVVGVSLGETGPMSNPQQPHNLERFCHVTYKPETCVFSVHSGNNATPVPTKKNAPLQLRALSTSALQCSFQLQKATNDRDSVSSSFRGSFVPARHNTSLAELGLFPFLDRYTTSQKYGLT